MKLLTIATNKLEYDFVALEINRLELGTTLRRDVDPFFTIKQFNLYGTINLNFRRCKRR